MSTDEGNSRNREGSDASGVTTDDKSTEANRSASDDYEPTTVKTTEDTMNMPEQTIMTGSKVSGPTTTVDNDGGSRSGGGSGTLDGVQCTNNNEQNGGKSYTTLFKYTRMSKRI